MAQRLNYNSQTNRYQHKKNRFGTIMCLLVLSICTIIFFLMYISLTMRADDFTTPTANNLSPSNIINPEATNHPPEKPKREWSLWHEMSPAKQESELERVIARAAPYGKLLGGEKDTSKFHNSCPTSGVKPMLLGKGGEHMVIIFQK